VAKLLNTLLIAENMKEYFS